jgi:hypothetical protein
MSALEMLVNNYHSLDPKDQVAFNRAINFDRRILVKKQPKKQGLNTKKVWCHDMAVDYVANMLANRKK